MVLSKKILKFAIKHEDLSVDMALAGALGSAGPLDVGPIAMALLGRKQSASSEALIIHYHSFDDEVKGAIIGRLGDLYSAVRKAAGRGSTHGPVNALEVIYEGRAYGLSYLVVELLKHGSDEIRRRAGEVLYELVVGAVARGECGDERGMEYLTDAVEQSVLRYDVHMQQRVLRSMAMLRMRLKSRLAGELGDWRSGAVEPLRGMLAGGEYGEIRRVELGMIGIETLQESCVTGIVKCANEGQLGDVLSLGHLVLAGDVGQAMEGMGDEDGVWPGYGQMVEMGVEQKRQLGRWAMGLGGSEGLKLSRLMQLAEVDDAITRLGGLRLLMNFDDGVSGYYESIARFCFDKEETIARIALGYLMGSEWEGLKGLLLRLVNSEHEDLREMAVGYLAPRGFGSLWSKWGAMTHEQRMKIGCGLIKMDRGFHQSLGRKLSAEDREVQLQAMGIIHELNQGKFFEGALIALACSGDEKLVASAVRALGTGETKEAVEMLETALGHGDSRVRANAVEALEEIESKHHIHRLVQMAASDENRPRANAIKALMSMRTDDAMNALTVMLQDGGAKQRISALWLVEEMGLLDLARTVAEMSLSDVSSDVTVRAKKVVGQLMRMMDPNDDMVEEMDVAESLT